MLHTIRYAMSVYYGKKKDWEQLVEQGMKKDFSWEKSVLEYGKLYNKITE